MAIEGKGIVQEETSNIFFTQKETESREYDDTNELLGDIFMLNTLVHILYH